MTLRESIDGLVQAWRAGDALRASAFFAAGGIYHEAGRAPIEGREAIAAFFTRFFRDGPAWRISVNDIVAEGERAAVAYDFEVLTANGWQSRAGCAIVHREADAIALWREYQG